jgi:uncharacterized protein (UPF0248 family)
MMQPIKDLLNMLKWDDRFSIEDYTLYYHDRLLDSEIAVDCKDIARLDGSFFVILRNGEEESIPLHRVTKVMKGGMNVWRRPGREGSE